MEGTGLARSIGMLAAVGHRLFAGRGGGGGGGGGGPGRDIA